MHDALYSFLIHCARISLVKVLTAPLVKKGMIRLRYRRAGNPTPAGFELPDRGRIYKLGEGRLRKSLHTALLAK